MPPTATPPIPSDTPGRAKPSEQLLGPGLCVCVHVWLDGREGGRTLTPPLERQCLIGAKPPHPACTPPSTEHHPTKHPTPPSTHPRLAYPQDEGMLYFQAKYTSWECGSTPGSYRAMFEYTETAPDGTSE